jgi:hypothetical protein
VLTPASAIRVKSSRPRRSKSSRNHGRSCPGAGWRKRRGGPGIRKFKRTPAGIPKGVVGYRPHLRGLPCLSNEPKIHRPTPPSRLGSSGHCRTVFPLTCPSCGGGVRIHAFITAAEPVDAIRTHLGLPSGPPPPANHLHAG